MRNETRQLSLFDEPEHTPAVGAYGPKPEPEPAPKPEWPEVAALLDESQAMIEGSPPAAAEEEVEEEFFTETGRAIDETDRQAAEREADCDGPLSFHRCNWPGCTQQVAAMHWACLMHTWALPVELRHALWQTPGTAEYIAADRAAKEYVVRTSLPRKEAPDG